MITQDVVAQKILAYLNSEIAESELVRWAEDAFVELTETDADIPYESTLLDILGYIGAGDTAGFPLTWATLADFLDQLGVKVRVIAER
ncbi:MAG: hypothetical protein U0521_16505 [Anaerolineae bacterium]